MTSVEKMRSVPPCYVDLALLREIENYAFSKVALLLETSSQSISENWNVTLRGPDFSESFHSCTEMEGSLLPNGLKEIQVGFSIYTPRRARVSIHFSRDNIPSPKITVGTEGPLAHEKAEQVILGFFRLIVERHNVMGWWARGRIVLWGVGVAAFPLAAVFKTQRPLATAIISVGTASYVALVTSFLYPSFEFATRNAEVRRKIRRAVGAFILAIAPLSALGSWLWGALS
jgi:hypothetical protein